jgi:ASC-1-like (ASCH) protein
MNRAIASLAVVKTVWETYRRDYIENFVPFVATLTKKKRYAELDASNLRSFLEDFKVEFGLSIPHHPMLTILDRARKRGIFERKASKLVPVEKNVLKYDFSDIAIKKEAELNKVISVFIKFCGEKFSVQVTEVEAQDALNSFLRNHDLEVLFASQDKTLLPESKASKQLKYLMNSFFNKRKGKRKGTVLFI